MPYEAEDPQPDGEREVYFDSVEEPLSARIVWRPGLSPGSKVAGPAVIEEPNSTTLLFPGDVAIVSEHGHLIVSVGNTLDEQGA